MENFIDFEDSKAFKLASIGLGFFNILFSFSHIFLINKINKNNERIQNKITETSYLSIIFQLISSSIFFGLLYKLYIKNTEFLRISYLIGVVTCLEWICFYLYYTDGNIIINFIFYLLIPIIIILAIFLLFFYVDDFNKIAETFLKNISFISYSLMLISPGINILNLNMTGNFKCIIITNIILGILCNIFMFLFIIALNHFKNISLFYIVYSILSILICIFEIYYLKVKNNYNNEDLDYINSNIRYSKDNDSAHKKISLVKRNSVEDE